MNNWFECKVAFEKVMENGIQKKVTESYLVDALSFAEAEARIIEEIKFFISGEFNVSKVGRKKYAEILFSKDGDKYYLVRINIITLDEKSGNEKKTSVRHLVQASTLKEAIQIHDDGMRGTLSDYVLAEVKETALIDVYPYEPAK